MAAAPPRLRRATTADAYALWIWANDEATREASFGREPIPWARHVEWLKDGLRGEHREILLAEAADALPVGSVRFDTDDAWETARLSYVVAPESRGRGYGTHLVASGLVWIAAHRPGAAVWAAVTPGNEPSLRIFRKAGWVEGEEEDGAIRFRAPGTSEEGRRT